MTEDRKKFPPCYADLESVFPMGEEGLRQTPESCMPCYYKTECLRKAVADKGGITVRQEMVDRAYTAGRLSFFERWSRKKALSEQKRNKIQKSKDK